jgi:hypothetical protein
MTRMGHDSMSAALIYQHASTEADRTIADALDVRLTALRGDDAEEADEGPDDPDEGAAGVREPVG